MAEDKFVTHKTFYATLASAFTASVTLGWIVYQVHASMPHVDSATHKEVHRIETRIEKMDAVLDDVRENVSAIRAQTDAFAKR